MDNFVSAGLIRTAPSMRHNCVQEKITMHLRIHTGLLFRVLILISQIFEFYIIVFRIS